MKKLENIAWTFYINEDEVHKFNVTRHLENFRRNFLEVGDCHN